MRSCLYMLLGLALVATISSGNRLAIPHEQELNEVDQATDGAYRDGLYCGRLDRSSSKSEHATWGRWSNDLDRRAFVQGYRRGYRGDVR